MDLKPANKDTDVSESRGGGVGSLKYRVFRAGGWAIGGHFASLMIRMVGSLILTRIFSPEVFGVLAIVMAMDLVIHLLTDIGLHQAVVQSPHGGNVRFLNTAWTVQILRGIMIWCVSAVAAASLLVAARLDLLPAGSAYAYPDLPIIMIVVSLTSVVLGFQSMKAVTANRGLDLKRLTTIGLVTQVIGLLFTIVLGLEFRSIWSYVAGSLLSVSSQVLLTHVWLHGSRDRLAWDTEALRDLKNFGKWIFASSALGAAAMNGDRMLLAGWASPALLGNYSIASNLEGVPETLANRVFGNVVLPTLSEVKRSRPEQFQRLYFRMRWVVDSVMVCAAGFLFATGAYIVGILYDPRYAPAGWILEYLSFGLLFARYGLAQNAYIALGRPSYITTINVTRFVSLFSLVPVLFYGFGIPGAVIGIAIHMLPSTAWVFYFNRRHGLNDLRIEAAAIGFWALGWLLGHAAVKIVDVIKVGVAGTT
jgi:O-antigen/teichoic acid export membrane protein